MASAIVNNFFKILIKNLKIFNNGGRDNYDVVNNFLIF